MTNKSDSVRADGKYIVTGGAGFIGSHLVEFLLSLGCTVLVVDDFSSGKMENLPIHDNLHVFNVDIIDWNSIEARICSGHFQDVTGVFHCAAEARIQPSINSPRKTYDANVTGTLNVLEMMRRLGIKNIVYSASSSSYGLVNHPPLREDMPSNCLNPYAATKLMGEELCKAWGNIYGIRNVCLKYFNVFGERSPIDLDKYSPVIGLFFKQALETEKGALTVVGDGLQKRDFTHVEDVVRANYIAMYWLQNEGTNASCNGLTVNIGTGSNYTILDLAEKVREVLKDVRPNTVIEHIDCRPGESRNTLADVSLAGSVLGWRASLTLEQSLRLLKPYYMNMFGVTPLYEAIEL